MKDLILIVHIQKVKGGRERVVNNLGELKKNIWSVIEAFIYIYFLSNVTNNIFTTILSWQILLVLI